MASNDRYRIQPRAKSPKKYTALYLGTVSSRSKVESNKERRAVRQREGKTETKRHSRGREHGAAVDIATNDGGVVVGGLVGVLVVVPVQRRLLGHHTAHASTVLLVIHIARYHKIIIKKKN